MYCKVSPYNFRYRYDIRLFTAPIVKIMTVTYDSFWQSQILDFGPIHTHLLASLFVSQEFVFFLSAIISDRQQPMISHILVTATHRLIAVCCLSVAMNDSVKRPSDKAINRTV